jgi:cysteine desulfurase
MLFFKTKKQKKISRHYFDFASSTPRDMRMITSFDIVPLWCSGANPSALHKEGVEIKKYLTRAHMHAAQSIGAHPDELYFTSGATESITTALSGIVRAHNDAKQVLFISPFEHSVTKALAEKLDVSTYYFKQEDGVVNPQSLFVPEGVSVVIVSLLYVQNEIGTLQPINAVAKRIRKLKKEYPKVQFYFHIDATQAPLYYDLNVRSLGIDMMSLGSTKLYCAKGVGMLYCARGVRCEPLLVGGSQEGGMRAGTEPVEQIYECAQALFYAQQERKDAYDTIKAFQTYCEKKIQEQLPQLAITSLSLERSPHITHVTYSGIESELLLLELDARGFALSSKSACTNDNEENSGIVEILFPKENRSSLRISYGRTTTKHSIDILLNAIEEVFKKYPHSSTLE